MQKYAKLHCNAKICTNAMQMQEKCNNAIKRQKFHKKNGYAKKCKNCDAYQGGKGAEITGPSSVLDPGCKMEEFRSGIPPSYSQLEPRSSVPRTAPAG
jgi:hypothetical protein